MTAPGGVSERPLLAAAQMVRGLAAAEAADAEAGRRLTAPVVAALRDSGLFRMCVPAVYGGPEVDPLTLVEAIETVAAGDGAAGWCTMIASTTSSMSVFLEPGFAQEIFGDPQSISGGVFAPSGTATASERAGRRGWEVRGRWQWGSGSQHCTWLLGGCTTDDGEFHLMFMDPAEITIHDTWHTVGMRGTGSHDFSADGAFVPTGRSVRPMLDRPQVTTALAAFPNFSLLAAGVAAVSLGVARHAIDEFVALAQGKRPLYSSRTLSQSGTAQTTVARAEATLGSARAFLLHELAVAWDAATSGGRIDVPMRVRIRMACVHAARAAAEATDAVYTMAGGTSVYESSPLQRCLRDAHVATQHLMVSPRLEELLGKSLLGMEIDASQL